MAKKCPPGVLCIENFTLFMLLLVCIGIVYFMRVHMLAQYHVLDKIKFNNIKEEQKQIIIDYPTIDKINGNMLLDPNVPPLKKRVNYVDTKKRDYSDRGVPINVRTRGNRLNSYTQIGFLKGLVRTNLIYPLYGRPNDTSRDKWNYYTLNDTGIKLPINKESKLYRRIWM